MHVVCSSCSCSSQLSWQFAGSYFRWSWSQLQKKKIFWFTPTNASSFHIALQQKTFHWNLYTERLMLCCTTTRVLSLELLRQGSPLPFTFVNVHLVNYTDDTVHGDEPQGKCVHTHTKFIYEMFLHVAIINALVASTPPLTLCNPFSALSTISKSLHLLHDISILFLASYLAWAKFYCPRLL